jgi:hypothetical protein
MPNIFSAGFETMRKIKLWWNGKYVEITLVSPFDHWLSCLRSLTQKSTLVNSQLTGNWVVSWLTKSKLFFKWGTNKTSGSGKTLFFCLMFESLIPIIGRVEPSPIRTESYPE